MVVLKARHAVWLVAVVASANCTGPRTTKMEVDAKALSDEGFMNYVANAPVVTVDEAYRAMLILADGESGQKTFETRKAELESRGIARAAWNLRADDVVDMGSVAYMACRICRIRGGVNMHAFGSWGIGDRRYALRELIYRELVDETVDYRFVRGSDLFSLVRKADELMEKKGLYESDGVDLTDEGDRDAQGNLIVPRPPGPPPERKTDVKNN